MDVVLLIPAHNEEEGIAHTLAAVPSSVFSDIIVIANACTDGTAAAAFKHGARVVEEPRKGYGQACLAGIAAIRRAEVVMFMDADGADDPRDIIKILEPVIGGEADMVLGSRSLGEREEGAMTLPQRFGNWLAPALIRLIWGFRYTDLGPLRAVRYDSLQSLGMKDRDYGWTVEMQIKAVKKRLRIREIPVRYRKRIGVSKISGTVRGVLGAGWKILWTIGRYAIAQ